MKLNDDMKFTILDGDAETQRKLSKRFLSTLTQEEHERAMSDEFAYLDEN